MGGLADFDYRSVAPRGELGRLVQTIWYARGTGPYESERTSPTGSCVAIIVLGDPIEQRADNGAAPPVCSDRGLLLGPHVGPVVNRPRGETHAVGIVFSPLAQS